MNNLMDTEEKVLKAYTKATELLLQDKVDASMIEASLRGLKDTLSVDASFLFIVDQNDERAGLLEEACQWIGECKKEAGDVYKSLTKSINPAAPLTDSEKVVVWPGSNKSQEYPNKACLPSVIYYTIVANNQLLAIVGVASKGEVKTWEIAEKLVLQSWSLMARPIIIKTYEKEGVQKTNTHASTLSEETVLIDLVGEALPLGRWEYDIKADVLMVNRQLIHILGLDTTMNNNSNTFQRVDQALFEGIWVKGKAKKPKKILDGMLKKRTPTKLSWEVGNGQGRFKALKGGTDVVSNAQGEVTKLTGFVLDHALTTAKGALLRESNESMKSVVEPVPIMINAFDKNGNIVVWNKACEKLTGYKEEEIVGNGEALKLLYPDAAYRDKIFHPWSGKTVNKQDSLAAKECVMVGKDGSKKVVFWNDLQNLIPVMGWSGWAMGVDITEQKKIEQELRESEERFRKVIEFMPSALLLVKRDNTIDMLNTKAVSLFGYGKEELQGKVVDILIPPASRKNHIIKQKKYFEKPIQQSFGKRRTIWALSKNGNEFPVEISLSPVEIGGEQFTLAIITDVSEIKAAEEAAMESNRKYSSLVDNIPGIIYRCQNQKDWSMEFISPAVEEVTGYRPSDFYPPNNIVAYNGLIMEDDREQVWRDVQKAVKNKETFKMIYRIKTRTGLERWVWEQGNGVFKKNGELEALEGCIFDITEKIGAEEMVISAILETEDKERRRISKEIHDSLQQTLIVASLNLEPVKKERALLSEINQERFLLGLDYLQRSISESRSIAHALMPKAIEDFGYVSAVEGLINEYNKNTRTKFHFHNNLNDDRLPLSVEVSLYRITQESLNNVIKYAKAKNVVIQLMKLENGIQLMIEDDGKGFDRDQILEEGKGFGLAGMKNRASGIFGNLHIDSHPGTGTSILVEVPLNKQKY